MSVKSFKFVSPGVFINEIDNSFIPKSADAIGPVVIGRATRGLAMTPVKVESYSEFVEMFGDTVPGNGGGDISRYGNRQSPMYGTYAAKAFLNANVAPLTYIRLLGTQNSNATSGYAGWKTAANPVSGNVFRAGGGNVDSIGGAFGLWLFPSGGFGDDGKDAKSVGTGSLAAIFYVEQGATVMLSGTMFYQGQKDLGLGKLIRNDSTSKEYTLAITSSTGLDKVSVSFQDTSENFIRKVVSTTPQLPTTAGEFYPASSHTKFWLGETFEQGLRSHPVANIGTDRLIGGGTDLTTANGVGVILPIASSSNGSTGPHNLQQQSSREAVAGWFIGQDLGDRATYQPEAQQKLFRLVGRGHGSWLSQNVKVSIEKIRQSNTTTSDYGTFSVVLRLLSDSDNQVQVVERFDNLTLDPTSPNFIARKIGDKYVQWDETNRCLKTYGEYDNLSKFVYVDMDATVEAGGTDPLLLPFGYYGPPKFSNLNIGGANKDVSTTSGISDKDPKSYVRSAAGIHLGPTGSVMLTGSNALDKQSTRQVTQGDGIGALFTFPIARLRHSASDGGLSDQTNAYFGLDTTRDAASTRSDHSVRDVHRLMFASFADDPTATTQNGVDAFSYIFSLDDVAAHSSNGGYYYASGSRNDGYSVSGKSSQTYKTLLDAGFDRFTAPFWGGFDGFDIHHPDPLYNAGMTAGTSNERNSYIFNTYRQAIDTIADPESLDMNLLTVPGLTFDSLTGHMIDVCGERADALALIDLANVYIPAHEAFNSNKKDRLGTTPVQAANNLRDRRIDSSYGATFYPWVQTRDAQTGQLLWIPPTVAMAGVLASSQAAADVWFAPAGFNRGGLSDGAAGIPVVGVTERLVSKDRDILYEARINPIASFPSSGIVVFGQKTLQERQSALDRINVRRLVIYLKKQISILSTQVLFEQNVPATWNRFKSLVEPFLGNVKTQFGITDYRLILDESTTTADLIDQNILYAKIMVKPARAIEYIAIDFVIASTGASFDD